MARHADRTLKLGRRWLQSVGNLRICQERKKEKANCDYDGVKPAHERLPEIFELGAATVIELPFTNAARREPNRRMER